MKNITNILKYIGLSVLAVSLFASCSNESEYSPYKESVAGTAAMFKFTNVAIGPLGNNFTVNWFLNDLKVTSGGVTTSEFPLGVSGAYPSSINYAAIASGNSTMRIDIPVTSAGAATTIVKTSLETQAQKNYSTFVVGASPEYSAYTINDDLSVALQDKSKAYIRFINVIANSPIEGYDLSIVELNSNAVIFSGVKYLAGNEIFIPIIPVEDQSTVAYEVQMRTAGTNILVAKTTFTPRKGRVYTIFNRGYVGGLSNGEPSIKVNIPSITYYTNK